ncbi:VapE domain-containing protein [Bacillus sp. 1NLA3E]|uniref:VapE domain-containing protein n=1 Tax=Bacillus sp. 1NLA3E TaxID=666686 RepID=UPI000247E707|nr:VapE domain-containing protein [Bacillus sp. 1NLA3E]AGK54901.1 hypothetical protein B1NLA3E_15775 [Bacillus sp. 1NLA3E]
MQTTAEKIQELLPNAKAFKLIGYSYRNKKKDYKDAKRPAFTGWNNENFKGLEPWQVEKELKQGYWIGARIPDSCIVVDIDDNTQGQLLKNILESENIHHHSIKTPNGYQFIFKHSGDDINQKVKYVTPLGIIVDYRVANKGYIVFPSQNTPERFVLTTSLEPLNELPSWLFPLWNGNKNKDAIPEYPITEGSRNDFLFSWACRLRQLNQTEKDTVIAVELINQYLLTEPIDYDEVERTLESAFNREFNNTLTKKKSANSPFYDLPSDAWEHKIELTQYGTVKNCVGNVLLVLENDEALRDKFGFNSFTKQEEVIGNLPWERNDMLKAMTDYDDACLQNYLSIKYGIVGEKIIRDVMTQLVRKNSFHPVRDYLNNLEWDGKSRLDNLLVYYFGADNTELTHTMTRLAFVGSVARVFEPGCKFDHVLTFKGNQGLGKSSFLRLLAVNDEWFFDNLETVEGKDAKEQLQGKWIIELAEMSAVSKKESNKVKQFITVQADEYRAAYARRKEVHKRQCVFFASTNDENPLKDETGGRRWWIVEVKEKWHEKAIRPDVDQLWAEAVHVYKQMVESKIPLCLPPHLEEQAKIVQSDNTDFGLYHGEVEQALEDGYYMVKGLIIGGKEKIDFDHTCAKHMWVEVLGNPIFSLTTYQARQINAVIKKHRKWKNLGQVRFPSGNYGKVTTFQRL